MEGKKEREEVNQVEKGMWDIKKDGGVEEWVDEKRVEKRVLKKLRKKEKKRRKKNI